jgi:serine/threonine protein kinase
LSATAGTPSSITSPEVKTLLEQPTTIGKYEVLSTIGRGGMGVVYKARDPQLDRLVAIKMIIGVNPTLLKRFDVEARFNSQATTPKHRHDI